MLNIEWILNFTIYILVERISPFRPRVSESRKPREQMENVATTELIQSEFIYSAPTSCRTALEGYAVASLCDSRSTNSGSDLRRMSRHSSHIAYDVVE